MTVTNAIKKLAKYGEVKQFGNCYSVAINGHVVSFCRNGDLDSATNFNVRRIGDQSQPEIDYSAGVYCNSLTQAIRLASR